MSIIVTARESIWSAQSTRSRPISIHEAIGSVAPSGDPVSAQACTIEMTNASPAAAPATPPANRQAARRRAQPKEGFLDQRNPSPLARGPDTSIAAFREIPPTAPTPTPPPPPPPATPAAGGGG